MRAVLDANIWLDLFVFDDPRYRPLRAQLEEQKIDAFSSPPCRDELADVAYRIRPRRYPFDPEALLAFHDRTAQLIKVDSPLPPLPQCRDPDDQKFVELAWFVRADIILSKDHALLKLNRALHQRYSITVAQNVDAGTAGKLNDDATSLKQNTF